MQTSYRSIRTRMRTWGASKDIKSKRGHGEPAVDTILAVGYLQVGIVAIQTHSGISSRRFPSTSFSIPNLIVPLLQLNSLSFSPSLSLRLFISPSSLAQMKFSATLHPNAIKARVNERYVCYIALYSAPRNAPRPFFPLPKVPPPPRHSNRSLYRYPG